MINKEYLENKIKDFEQRHQYMGYLTNSFDKELARRWQDEQAQKTRKWHAVNSNDDVVSLINRFDSVVSVYEGAKHGHYHDAFDMALALYDALLGFRKWAQFADESSFNSTNFTPISKDAADELFVRLASIASRMDKVNMKRAMSD